MNAMANPPDHNRISANRAFALLATAFALLFSAVVALLAFDQHRVLEAAQRLQSETVPAIVRFQRLARNRGLLARPGAHPALMGADRPMGDGWICVEQAALQGPGLESWLEPALTFHAAQGAE